ncbi:MAG: GntR family transcriptional regulator [Olegusella sp.]|nr:GntR family transcriptional regulator [Olegusella sp.]
MKDEKDISARPKYLVIREDVRGRIEDGTYPIGGTIPSENELALAYDTTRLTARSAIDGLVEEGLVCRVQGKGAFVVGDARITSRPPQGFRAHQQQRMHEAEVRIIDWGLREAGPLYAYLFGVGQDDLLVSLRRINVVDGSPRSLEQTLIPCSTVPGIEYVDPSVFSLYDSYARLGHAVSRVREEMGVSTLAAREARHLGVPAGTVALTVRGLSYDVAGAVIEYNVSLTPEDRATYTVRF